MPKLFRVALRAVAINAAWGTVLGTIFFASGGAGTFEAWALSAFESITYSLCIGVPGMLFLFGLSARWRAPRSFARTLGYFALILPIAVVGCFLADVIFVAVGRRAGAQLLPEFVRDLRTVLMISGFTGAGIIGYQRLRDRLDEAETRLREEELARERALRLAADAQLASLESRIRPHFLFNALNTVLALIPDDPKRAEAVLERLTSLLRASLRAPSEALVPLADEASLVKDYLEIERARFGDRLKFAIDVANGAASTLVPAFSVQTLVENSVKHVVARRREGATLRVVARLDGARAIITVEDDGPGIDAAALPRGHGLDTLRARIDAIFGASGALEIDGARVTLRFPAKAREAARFFEPGAGAPFPSLSLLKNMRLLNSRLCNP